MILFLLISFNFLYTKLSKNPIIKNVTPNVLNVFVGVFLINSNIFLTLDGKMARNNPSIKKTNPIAVIISPINELSYLFLTPGLTDFPKI